MKKYLWAIGLIIILIVVYTTSRLEKLAVEVDCYKPIIYLYPEEVTDVTVKLEYDGKLTSTYPTYNDGWNIKAYPDGTLIGENGREYYGLFWEGINKCDYDISEGFVIEGNKTEQFLETSLKKLGLTDKEANEFIIFWLPQMENNKYNFISFQKEAYTDSARLTVSPEPESLIRVFMAWKSLEEKIDVKPQTLETPQRKGFTVVEWGGTILK